MLLVFPQLCSQYAGLFSIALSYFATGAQAGPYMLKVLEVNGLSSLVSHATFFNALYVPYLSRTTWVDFSLISQFRRLRSLTLVGSPFVHEHEQLQFINILDRVSPLKSFTYIFPGQIASSTRSAAYILVSVPE